jgi:hypothetical protein
MNASKITLTLVRNEAPVSVQPSQVVCWTDKAPGGAEVTLVTGTIEHVKESVEEIDGLMAESERYAFDRLGHAIVWALNHHREVSRRYGR